MRRKRGVTKGEKEVNKEDGRGGVAIFHQKKISIR